MTQRKQSQTSILLFAVLGGLACTSVANAQLPASSPANTKEILSNENILSMVAAGLPEAAIIAKINSSATAFELSTDKLIALKQKGVSGGVLAAMLSPAVAHTAAATAAIEFSADSPDIAVPHYPGVYIYGAQSKTMTRIMPTSSNQAKTGGIIGYALTAGIASMSVKATIPGAAARIRSGSAQPVFYVYFDESVPRALQSNGMSVWTTGLGSMTTSPCEMSLVRFMEKKNAREARVGSMNIAGGKSGVMDKDRISFESELVRPGVFKVTPTSPMEPGEYGFIQALTGGNVSGGGGAMTARVFDFGVVR